MRTRQAGRWVLEEEKRRKRMRGIGRKMVGGAGGEAAPQWHE
jgi:hypothetical protein